MRENLPNFPQLFDQIGSFLFQFDALRRRREKLSPEAFMKEFDILVKGSSPASADEAKEAYQQIVDTVYLASARACPTGSTRMRA